MEAADERRPRPALKFNFGKFETPLTIKQVETHLIFGPLARHVSFAWLVLGLFGAWTEFASLTTGCLDLSTAA